MYVFEAEYTNENGEHLKRVIQVDPFLFHSEQDCYMYAVKRAFDMKEYSERLYSLEFVRG